MDEANGIWVEYLAEEILWSYRITPHSNTKETPFRMVYRVDVMIPMKINSPTWRRLKFNEDLNNEGLDNLDDFIEEIRGMTHVRECTAKQRMARRFNTRVRPRSFQEGDLVLKIITDTQNKGKLSPN